MRVSDITKETLYVAREVENYEDLAEWAESQGLDTEDEYHVTIAYSKEPVDWDLVSDSEDSIKLAPDDERSIEEFDGGAIVLRLSESESEPLEDRWQEIMDLGASWDYQTYKPHISVGKGRGLDTSLIEPYSGKIELGPERHEPLDPV